MLSSCWETCKNSEFGFPVPFNMLNHCISKLQIVNLFFIMQCFIIEGNYIKLQDIAFIHFVMEYKKDYKMLLFHILKGKE